MKTSNLTGLVAALLLICTTSILGQKTPDYQYQFDGQVKWMILHESGTLISSTGEALVGIRPNNGEIAFKFNELKKVKEENLETVAGTPYLIIKPKGMLNQGHASVVDVVKGKLVFDSRRDNWQGGVQSRHLITPEMMFIVNGMHKGNDGKYKQGVGIYDLISGNLINVIERKASNIMVGKPDIIGDEIIIPGMKDIQSYTISTGSLNWKSEVKNATGIVSLEENKEMYAYRRKGDNTEVYKINAANGQLMWSDPNKIKGVVSRYEFTPHGLAIVTNVLSSGKKGLVGKIGNAAKGSGTSKVYLLDLNTGEDLWAKSPKTKGIISHFYVEDDGIIFGVSTGGINKIAFDGTPRWKKPLKTGPGIQIMARGKKGLLYISETDTDLIDFATGESVFGKTIKYKRSEAVASTLDEERERFLITCKDGIYAVNGDTGAYDLLTDQLPFEGKEVPTSISVRKEGILLSSDQNLMLLDFNGEEIWHVYHRAPGKSAAGAIFAGAMALASATVAVSESAQAGAMKGAGVPSYNSTVQMHEANAENFGNAADAGFKEMLKRFNATKATENSAFILTKVDGGISLVKVDKDSGNTLDTILIKDKDPMYEVDDIEGVLYFKSKSNTINGYKLVSN